MIVRSVVFGPSEIYIEYVDEDAGVFPISHQIDISLDLATKDEQLMYDIRELMQDAQTVLDSALQARHSLSSSLDRRMER